MKLHYSSLLDLSAAFDTVDHDISSTDCTIHLVFAMRYCLGSEVSWLGAYRGAALVINTRLPPRFTTAYHGQCTRTHPFPVIYGWCARDCCPTWCRHSFLRWWHSVEFYLHTTTNKCKATFTRLLCCIDDVGLWMCSNRLKLNTEKTQFTCCGTRYQISQGRRHWFHGKRLSGYVTSYCHLPWHHRGSRNVVCWSP